MSKLVYTRSINTITYYRDDGSNYSYECSHDFEEGYNEYGEPRESLPVGVYIANAEPYPGENSRPFGTFYIDTGDSRGRAIHGGGSGCEDPFASRQDSLRPTYGCLRMYNVDGEELSSLMIEDGNGIELEVSE